MGLLTKKRLRIGLLILVGFLLFCGFSGRMLLQVVTYQEIGANDFSELTVDAIRNEDQSWKYRVKARTLMHSSYSIRRIFVGNQTDDGELVLEAGMNMFPWRYRQSLDVEFDQPTQLRSIRFRKDAAPFWFSSEQGTSAIEKASPVPMPP